MIAQRCLYGGTYAVLSDLAARHGVEVEYVGATTRPRPSGFRGRPPGCCTWRPIADPTGRVPDLAGLLAVARRHGVVGVVDNSPASPVLCRPVEHGADVVVHSTTKYLAGPGGAEVVLVRQVLGLCLRLGLRLSAGCSPRPGA